MGWDNLPLADRAALAGFNLKANEVAAADLLIAARVMISCPGDGDPESDLYDHWGVCVGSHGGYAKTLKAAMRRCLRCCGIGKWWRVAPPKNKELLRALFKRVADKHLGGLRYNPNAREL